MDWYVDPCIEVILHMQATILRLILTLPTQLGMHGCDFKHGSLIIQWSMPSLAMSKGSVCLSVPRNC